MRNIVYILMLAGATGMLSSCSDFLDRQPLSQVSPENGFNTETELKLYTNSFYDMLPTAEGVYNEDVDNIVKTSLSPELTGNRTVPQTDDNWSSTKSWNKLRNINYFLQNYNRGHLDSSITGRYVGVARFFRAYFYFNMVARYGDVPWYSVAIEPNDSTALQKSRDPRTLVIDSVIADLNYAISHLPTGKTVDQVSKWTALALKSRVCLFEGTFRKYHTELGLPNANDLLQQSADAADQLITSGTYKLYTSTPDKAYGELFSSLTPITDEVILARLFSTDLQIYHNLNYYTLTPSYGKPGLEKKLSNSYLMKDGTRFTDRAGYDTVQFFTESRNRDPRFSQTVRTPGYTRIGQTVPLAPDLAATVTGYQMIKFVTSPTYDVNSRSINPMPIFRYAEALLNYAEAKAELGTLTQADIDRTIKLTRARVGMPNLVMADANAQPDPYLKAQYTQVKGANTGVILEIRRERRIELVMESFRWNDLMRWKEGHLLAEQYKGMYFPGPGLYDLDGDGKTDVVLYTGTKPSAGTATYLKLGSDIDLEDNVNGGDVVINKAIPKTFDENRDYLFPIPIQERLLNHNLKQNPGWNDGLPF